MTHSPDILLLADGTCRDSIIDRLGRARVLWREDPYDMLAALGSTDFATVLLTAPRPDLADLCKAARRVRTSARLLGLCSVAAEPQLGQLPRGLLDNYYIYPPTAADIAAIVGAPAAQGQYLPAAHRAQAKRPVQIDPSPTSATPAGPTATGPGAPSPVAPAELAAMIQASTSMANLEKRVADWVAAQTSLAVEWADAQHADEERVLLMTNGEPVRMLMGPGPLAQLPAPAQERLASLQQCLPALAENARRIESLHRLAVTDHLTGAYNRRYFYHLTDQILMRAGGSDTRVTLLLYDIDNFKHYNETYGHAAGDEILRETAALMKRTSRAHDVVARIGGDEFAVLFWDAEPPRTPGSRPLETAQALADRFRKAVSNHSFPSLGPEAQGALTISGGLATFPDGGTTCRQLLRSADNGLREVKRTGKNNILLVGRE